MAKKVLSGIPVSSGVAIGKAFFLNRGSKASLPRMSISAGDVPNEKERLLTAFEAALQELDEIRQKIPSELKEHAAIIDSHLMILKDENFKQGALRYIQDKMINAEWALEKTVADIGKAFSRIDDEYIRQRIQDVRLVADRVQDALRGKTKDIGAISQRVILLAHDLSPADTIALQVDKIMAFATTMGGKTSHAGIMARSLQIPAVVGVEGLEEDIEDGQLIILDGFHGRIIVGPSEEELAEFADIKYQFEAYQSLISKCCHLPAETIDGYQVQVLANIELFEEVAAVIDHGGEGIGLYRTEYSYLNRETLPTEEELFEEYRDLADIMHPRKVIIRTLDMGADKIAKHFGSLEEANPALGLRAIRFCLKHRQLFKAQLRAILRASVVGNISIMFPLISGLQELQEVKEFYFEVQEELRKENVPFNEHMPMGIMIEVPGSVLIADILAKEVDFFSIGTNDLIQYSLGIDRTNKHVSYLYQPLHPAILRSIKLVVDAAHEAGIEVSLCGEVAADPFCVPILMGMQVDSLSLNPQAIPGIKRIIRRATMEECKQLLKQVIDSDTVARSNKLVREMIYNRFPEELMFYTSLIDE
ncbi:phosphoenolpyruvate--protein phosphotransferase [Desulfohalobiaceae bacterium Ax17]|uniref:phosphoenolpyruvate--protein phosphotransferase n=1 Tax=Desulfovulcanus ferrireducens TaxID=2831190 RepID=UPI00207BB783|nr:phosphoenolpyruvate--protein phosphotransferase [Desulfovulcanus ferrireducens]MBT8764225.1 phosphoenolpyruvate--protein phosphotransferase [Desulfovulcanus ferrireducens]